MYRNPSLETLRNGWLKVFRVVDSWLNTEVCSCFVPISSALRFPGIGLEEKMKLHYFELILTGHIEALRMQCNPRTHFARFSLIATLKLRCTFFGVLDGLDLSIFWFNIWR